MAKNAEYIVIGGGIAGLYTAFRIQQQDPEARVRVLEKSAKVGGRLATVRFAGMDVPCGAGIGRKRKDRLLAHLCEALNVNVGLKKVQHRYASTLGLGGNKDAAFIARHGIQQLKEQGRDKDIANISFRSFGQRVLGKQGYDAWTAAIGYTDFERDDAGIVLEHYGLEDNLAGWSAMMIPWKALVQALVQRIGRSNILTNIDVARIRPSASDGWEVSSSCGKMWLTRCVVLAVEADALQRLLPIHLRTPYSGIKGQPFARIYAQASAGDAQKILQAAVPALTVVPVPLQKIIPMNPALGIYMIAYADNAAAKACLALAERGGKEALAREIEIVLGLGRNTIKFDRMHVCYWKNGTHLTLPGSAAAREGVPTSPAPGLWVVGEAVAKDKGWVEGALESVEEALKHAMSHN